MSVSDFKDRLREVIGEGRNSSAFAKKCDFTEGVLRRYLAGDSLPGLDKLVRIAEVANVSIEWLATGEGTAKKESNNPIVPIMGYNDNTYIHVNQSPFSSNDKNEGYGDPIAQAFLKDWLSLSDVVKMRVWTLVKEELEKKREMEG